MFEIAIGIVIGLVLGWVFIPQPQWVKNFVEGLKSD